MATARYHLPITLRRHRRRMAVAFGVLLVLAAAGTAWQARQMWAIADLAGERLLAVGTPAGLLGAGVYRTGTCLLLQTRVRTMIVRVLAPLGRMAFTNFVAPA